MRRHAILAAAAFVVAACTGDFDPSSRVTRTRLLAVRADLPIAAPGETVSLEGLAVDPAGRSLTWAWSVCVDPPSSTPSACVASRGEVTRGLDLSKHAVVAPPDASVVGVVVMVCPGELVLDEAAPKGARCLAGGGPAEDELEVGMKRILVRPAARNANPAIVGLRWDGTDWPEDVVHEVDACRADATELDDCPAGLAHRLELLTSAPERGVDPAAGPFAEQQIVQTYATEGIFEHEVRVAEDPATRWVARANASGREVRFWLVARDDRGGVAWTTRRVRVR